MFICLKKGETISSLLKVRNLPSQATLLEWNKIKLCKKGKKPLIESDNFRFVNPNALVFYTFIR